MNGEICLKGLLKTFEEKLIDPSNRKNPAEIAYLLSDEFIEIGSSGTVYRKKDILDALRGDSEDKLLLFDFNLVQISHDVALVTYMAQREAGLTGDLKKSLRSSIWRIEKEGWKLVFHQGTSLP